MAGLEIAVLIGSFGLLLVLGLPVAFAIGIATTLTLLLSVETVPALTTVAQRMATGLDAFTLVAIPFFILAGELMNRGGMARRLVDLAKALIGGLPGGLALVNILAATLFGAVSGSAVAAASAIGTVLGPRMEREGYDRGFSAAVNITAATTGLIIPPSNILIVYSLASGGVSIAALFLAGYLPGLLVSGALMLVAGSLATQVRAVREKSSFGHLLRSFLDALPSLLLLVLVVGGLVAGIFTATEAAAVAVLYALILAQVYGELRVRQLPEILLAAVSTTAVVMLLIATSMAMSWVLSYASIPQDMTAFLLALTDSKVMILLLIHLVLLTVGTVMDMTPAVLIFTPIFLPVVLALGMDATHFGIVLVLNLCIGLCTPPVGSVLFVGCGVARIRVAEVVRPLLPFFAAMLVVLLIVTYVPAISLWLPRIFGY